MKNKEQHPGAILVENKPRTRRTKEEIEREKEEKKRRKEEKEEKRKNINKKPENISSMRDKNTQHFNETKMINLRCKGT